MNMCQRYCDKKQLFTVAGKYFDNNYFTISCLAQRYVQGGGLIEGGA